MDVDRYSLLTVPEATPPLYAEWDRTHVWGCYAEAQLSRSVLLRSILIHPQGRTSVHRHSRQSEINVVTSGAIRVFIGASPDELHDYVVTAGNLVHVPANHFHAVEWAASAGEPDTAATYVEVVYDFQSHEDIDRAVVARPGDAVSVLMADR
jgi:mannose-6-phosphate isomerase-like protein (cupin superfamily)